MHFFLFLPHLYSVSNINIGSNLNTFAYQYFCSTARFITFYIQISPVLSIKVCTYLYASLLAFNVKVSCLSIQGAEITTVTWHNSSSAQWCIFFACAYICAHTRTYCVVHAKECIALLCVYVQAWRNQSMTLVSSPTCCSARLAGQQVLIYLPSTPTMLSWQARAAFHVGAGVWTQILMLAEQAYVPPLSQTASPVQWLLFHISLGFNF